MITLTCKKFNWQLMTYQAHRQEHISAELAQKIIDKMASSKVVEGFYQYSMKMEGMTYIIYTACADLAGWVDVMK